MPRAGFAIDGKPPAFCAVQDRKKRRKFCPQHCAMLSMLRASPGWPLSCAILLRSSPGWPSMATRVTHALRPWSPVERMRSTHGRIHAGPERDIELHPPPPDTISRAPCDFRPRPIDGYKSTL